MSNDPMEILNQTPGIFTDWGLQSLAMFMRRAGLIISILAMAFSLVSIIFSNNPQNASENKKDIVNKLFIVFLISSMVVIFNIVKGLFDAGLAG